MASASWIFRVALVVLLFIAYWILFGAYLIRPGVVRDLYLKAAARSTIPTPRFLLRFYRSRGFLILLRVIGALGVLGGIYVVWSLIRGR